MITPDIRAKDLYSNRYAGQATPELPEALRRRLYSRVLDGFRHFKYRPDPDLQLWIRRALVLGISSNQENGMRYLANAYQRLTGVRPPVGPLDLASRWLEDMMVTSEAPFCLDILDILMNQWWNDDRSEAAVNELFKDHGRMFKVVNRRVKQASPVSLRRPKTVANRVHQTIQPMATKAPWVSDLAYHARVCEKRPYDRIKRELHETGHSFTSLPKLVYYRMRRLRESSASCPICRSPVQPRSN